MTATRSRRNRSTTELEQFLRDLRLTFNQLRDFADSLHADLGITASLRAVIEFLALHGPSTVPAIAAERAVSRQGIQTLVNHLLKAGLVKRGANPEHRRSDLIVMTAAGRRIYRQIRERERRYLREIAELLSCTEITRADRVLRAIRSGITEAKEGVA